MSGRISKNAVTKIGTERISVLRSLSVRAVRDGKTDRARRYVDLERRIAGKCQIAIPKEFGYCKRCLAPSVPGVSCRVRTGKGRVRTTCLLCGNVSRHPYVRERSNE